MNSKSSIHLPTEDIRTAWQSAGLDNGALNTLRRDALDEFLRAGLPSTRQENWKYTNISALADQLTTCLQKKPSAAPSSSPTLALPDAVHLTFVDGVYRPELSDKADLPEGVKLASLADLVIEDPVALQKLFGRLASMNDSALVALNAAFAGQGTALLIADGVKLTKPVCINYRSGQAHAAAQPRLLVSLGRGAAATVVENFCSTQPAFVNPVAELYCAADAHLDYYKLQAEHAETWHTAVQCIAVENNAQLRTTHVDYGGALARNELKIALTGRGAHAESRGLFMADRSRHVESRIDVRHEAPDTTSRERFRGILAGRARGVFNGRIYVGQKAQKTAAELTNRNLLLSKGAEINTKPELEIYADDVKCAHGSTTGQLDATSMFYLLSRGVDRETARNMLITAFAAELLTDISIPVIAEQAKHALESLQSESGDGKTRT
jgi:Fe-S cluster assembly protein SufD